MKTKKSVKKRFWITRNRGNSCSRFFCHSFGRSDLCELASPMPLNRGRSPVVTPGKNDERSDVVSLRCRGNKAEAKQLIAFQKAEKKHDIFQRSRLRASKRCSKEQARNQSILARSGSAKKGFNPVIIKKCDKKRLLKCSPRSL
jgi:hypothetical protein